MVGYVVIGLGVMFAAAWFGAEVAEAIGAGAAWPIFLIMSPLLILIGLVHVVRELGQKHEARVRTRQREAQQIESEVDLWLELGLPPGEPKA
jgi:hypothetical protein